MSILIDFDTYNIEDDRGEKKKVDKTRSILNKIRHWMKRCCRFSRCERFIIIVGRFLLEMILGILACSMTITGIQDTTKYHSWLKGNCTIQDFDRSTSCHDCNFRVKMVSSDDAPEVANTTAPWKPIFAHNYITKRAMVVPEDAFRCCGHPEPERSSSPSLPPGTTPALDPAASFSCCNFYSSTSGLFCDAWTAPSCLSSAPWPCRFRIGEGGPANDSIPSRANTSIITAVEAGRLPDGIQELVTGGVSFIVLIILLLTHSRVRTRVAQLGAFLWGALPCRLLRDGIYFWMRPIISAIKACRSILTRTCTLLMKARYKLCCRASPLNRAASRSFDRVRGARKKDEPAKTAKVHSVVDRVPPALTPLQPSVLEALRSEYKIRAMPHSFFENSAVLNESPHTTRVVHIVNHEAHAGKTEKESFRKAPHRFPNHPITAWKAREPIAQSSRPSIGLPRRKHVSSDETQLPLTPTLPTCSLSDGRPAGRYLGYRKWLPEASSVPNGSSRRKPTRPVLRWALNDV
ncbi:hypothetical protein FOZ63_033735 [Perkinsus olseni]|uniref:Uncharacterized protein n=2 Tax=Perkinsus olseni TaxID=32597 RepID=A0A7J6ST81_PEROL|nr:hypothetical protein FOZ63_033735 [Perkinsus olseni]